MVEPRFSNGEAISHGWKMMKKYWLNILLVGVVFLLFQGANRGLVYFAGLDTISPMAADRLCSDKAKGAHFYQLLIDNNYIDKYGRAQNALKMAGNFDSLILPDELRADRYKICKFLDLYRYRLPFSKNVYWALLFAFWVCGLVLTVGSLKISLMLTRDTEPDLSELFVNWRLVITYLLASICYFLAVLGGIILLIIPGFIFSIMFGMYTYLIVDKELGPIEALKRSRAITKGQRWRLASFWGVLVLLNIGGLLCLIVGIFATMGITFIASAYVYDRLENLEPVVV